MILSQSGLTGACGSESVVRKVRVLKLMNASLNGKNEAPLGKTKSYKQSSCV